MNHWLNNRFGIRILSGLCGKKKKKTQALLRFIFLLKTILIFCNGVVAAEDKKEIYADSIMSHVFMRSEIYGKYIREYTSQTYIKGTTQVLKKNILFRFAPNFLALDKKNNNTVLEAIVEMRYFAPNSFTQKIEALNGTSLNTDDIYHRVMQFLNVNVYNPTSFNDEILMPTSRSAHRYYRFFYESSQDTLDYRVLKIKLEPKIKSQKLISGYIYIVDKLWTVARIDIKGKWDFSEFRVQTNFGLPEKNFLLPIETDLSFSMDLLGNKVVNHYTSVFDYTSVIKYEEDAKRPKIKYDLSDHFSLSLDTLPVIRDSLFWQANRPMPLTSLEEKIYQDKKQKTDSIIDKSLRKKDLTSWTFAKGIFTPRRFEYNSTQFRYSGILNPFKFAYSGLDGLVYWQQLKLNKQFEAGRIISFNPDIGFVFKRKEIYFNTPVSFIFNPQKFGQLNFSLGNRNQSYSSRVIDEINTEIPDSIDFDDLNLEYYKHYYVSLSGQYELFNGFQAFVGTDFHLYKPVKSSNPEAEELEEHLEGDLATLVDDNYRSFTPTIGLKWTPGQFYRINGKQKEYLWSFYPTFTFQYARGIAGILGSDSKYERIEADIQQRISLGLLRSVQYYAGAGIFTNTRSLYFADFTKFARRNFPQSWDDRIGGVFQLLDSHWYNASASYIQFHAMYESPFVILHFFKNVTKDIFKERFYYSQLYTPVLPYYTEFGYGVGNYLLNVGIFVSFEKGKYERFGFKFAFELGR